jgi:ABC-type cobalamin/Fe3+-siderophores transport system ATPase subunit
MTLLQAITRILKLGKDEVSLEGKNIWEMGFKELAKNIAVVSQDYETGYMSVEEPAAPVIITFFRVTFYILSFFNYH